MDVLLVDGGFHRADRTWGLGWRYEPCHKLYLPRTGSACYLVEDDAGCERAHRLRPGELVFLPGGRRHRAEQVRGFALHWVHLRVEDPMSDVVLSGAAAPVPWPDPPGQELCAAFSSIASRARGAPAPAEDLHRLAAQLHLLVAHLLAAGRSTGREGVAWWRRRLAPAVEALTARLPAPIAVPALARLAGLGVRQLARGTRCAWGLPPRRLIEELRLRQAERLLLTDPGRRLAEVAAACGYADPFHFSRVFRRCRGLSPDAFRRRGPG